MRIGEVAQRAGVSASRLRFYEAKGSCPRQAATPTAIAPMNFAR